MRTKRDDIKNLVMYSTLIEKLENECKCKREISRERLLFLLGVCYTIPKCKKNDLIAELLEANVIEVKRTYRMKIYYGLLEE